MLRLSTQLAAIPDIGPRFLAYLKKLHIETVRDLLWHFPSRYEDFSQMYSIADLEPGQHATVQGVIEDVGIRRSWLRRNLTIVEATVADETGRVRAVWFNQPYLKNTLRPGRRVNLSGKVTLTEHELSFSHPTYEIIPASHADDALDTKHTARLVPIYPETKGLTSKGIRFIVQPVLANLDPIDEWIPADILRAHRLPSINEALRTVHFPDAVDDAERAKRRFAFEDLFLLQLVNLKHKQALAAEQAPPLSIDLEHVKLILKDLPYELTPSQKRSLWEIVQDLQSAQPMNRILQGDVGSGKTVVVAIAALLAAANGYQTAFLAPTEVLARQHFATLTALFPRVRAASRPRVGLVTASEARLSGADEPVSVPKQSLLAAIADGTLHIAIGTHALLEESVSFSKLGFVIIDEQHRFGVEQRAKLSRASSRPDGRSSAALTPHFLSMSATPIPRTLMLTVFGDLDISMITELPSGRKPIVTKIVPPEHRMTAYRFIKSEIKKGRQAFVICPRIEKDDEGQAPAPGTAQFKSIELKSVKEEFQKLSKKIFPDLRVAMLHGQLKAKEKARIMESFRNGEIDILVSTSVIEVGVDVPNATIMMIEGSDRFGLAQLYQFRGRVGRGEHQSSCFLFTDSESASTKTRLKAIIEAKNGFELAERDLSLRGPGEFLGQKQTGLPDVAMHGLQNPELIKASREAATFVLKNDPSLSHHAALKEKIAEFEKRIHLE